MKKRGLQLIHQGLVIDFLVEIKADEGVEHSSVMYYFLRDTWIDTGACKEDDTQ